MSSAQQVVASIAGGKAVGGAVTFDGGYAIHTFTASGTFIANEDLTVEYLVVAGGGGGYTAGGGAGGLLTASGFAVNAGVFTVTVGAGLPSGEDYYGQKAGDSVFSSITATGGGHGAGPGVLTSNGANGGSGGGAGNQSGGAAGTGVSGQGYAGGQPGNDVTYKQCGGSGGGAGGAGSPGTTNGTSTSAGGLGVVSSISGAAIEYAKGGNAYPYEYNSAVPVQLANRGHGGHGGYATTPSAGSDGIVIIKYAL